MTFDYKYKPDSEYRFWLFDPEGEGTTFWRSEEERDTYATGAIAECYDGDGWSEDVQSLCVGVITHVAQVKDKKMRPEVLDEEGCDEEGNHWPEEWQWTGNYTLEPLEIPE